MDKFKNLLKENKLLTAITAIHLFLGPFLYHSLGLIDISRRYSSDIYLNNLFNLENALFYWAVTVVLVFMFWLFKK